MHSSRVDQILAPMTEALRDRTSKARQLGPDAAPDRARLWELHRHRLGARPDRPGPDRGRGPRADGRRVGAGDHPLRHGRRLRRRATASARSGSWIASRRDRPTLTTKTFNPIFPNADHGLSAKRIARRLPASLERLGVDRVELYLAHDYDPVVPLAETFAEFERLAGGPQALRLRGQQLQRGAAAERACAPDRRSRSRTATRCSSAVTRSRCCRSAGTMASRTSPTARSPAAG